MAKKRPISFRDLIDSPLPTCQYQVSTSGTNTVAAGRLRPTEVVGWAGLESAVEKHRLELNPYILDFTPAPPNEFQEMSSETFEYSSEAELYSVFRSKVCLALNQLFNASIITQMPGNQRITTVSNEGSRRADFVSRRNRNGTDGAMDGAIIAVWELKSDSLRRDGVSLVELYNSAKPCTHVREAIYQVVGYLVSSNCKYGFISSFSCSWAVRLTSSGVLHVSRPFYASCRGPRSCLNMVYYVLERSNSELQDGPVCHATLDTPPLRRREAKAHAHECANPTEAKVVKPQRRMRGGCAPLTFLRVMMSHHDRITWQARTGDGQLVAVKYYRDAAARDRETLCYEKLRQLQGISIPRLLEPNCTEEEDGHGRRHGLMLEWVGAPQGGNYMLLPARALRAARGVLAAMHARGVAHGDVRAENMHYNFTTRALAVFDFSRAVVDTLDGEEAWGEACEEDEAALDSLLAWSESDAGRRARYVH
jgi:hypothetical protein